MMPDPVFFRDLAYVFVAAVVGGTLAWLARQPLVIGYVVGGILVSPLTPGPAVSDVRTFELFAEVGVILLMFSIGIEFSLKDLARVKWVALAGGPLGILLSVALGLLMSTLIGWPLLQGAVVGIVVSVASTMVLGRLLMDRGELGSRHGRITVGISLTEDLVVVMLIVLLPTLGRLEPGRLVDVAVAMGTAVLILVPFGLLAARVVPWLMTHVARTRNQELFLLVALAIALGTAALTQAVGLSLALGAFLAGLVISESDYAHETLARLLSLRDAFVALFFVTLGALIDPASLFENLPLLGTMIGLVVVGKLLIWTTVVSLFGYPVWTALLVGVWLTQIGEFSFILVQVARGAGLVGREVYNATLATALFTILLNAVLVRAVPGWIGPARLARRLPAPPRRAGEEARSRHVVLCGFGRVGSAVGEALETFGVPYVVIETDPDIVRGLRGRGVPCVFGDAVHRPVLAAAGAERASLAIVTLPQIDRARLAVRSLRAANPGVPILARAHRREEHESLRQAGATEVIQPELEAAATLIRHALDRLALPRERVLDYLSRLRDAMERADETAGGTLPAVREVGVAAAGLADQSLREARIRERFGVTVVAVVRAGGETVFNPPPETVLRAEDRIRVFGLPEQIQALRPGSR
jgi:CPA2 family monovalent cation:H+ antiporter-2